MFRKVIIFLGTIVLVITVVLTLFTNMQPTILINNEQLNYSFKNQKDSTIVVNDIVPFTWDDAYYFSPYVSLDTIKTQLNIKRFPDNLYAKREGHLIFLYNNHVEAIVHSFGRSRGYWFNFKTSESYEFTPEEKIELIAQKQVDGLMKYTLN